MAKSRTKRAAKSIDIPLVQDSIPASASARADRIPRTGGYGLREIVVMDWEER